MEDDIAPTKKRKSLSTIIFRSPRPAKKPRSAYGDPDANYRGTTLFHDACSKGNIDAVSFWLNSPPGYCPSDINLDDPDGNTALMLACSSDHPEIVDLLLSAHPDIDVNFKNSDGETALMCAVVAGATRCIELILAARGDDVDIDAQNVDGMTALMYAAEGTDMNMVPFLLSQRPDIDANRVNHQRHTALMIFCRKEYNNNDDHDDVRLSLDVLRVLVDHSLDTVNHRNDHGATALHLLCQHARQPKLIMLLAQHPTVDVNAVDNRDGTALIRLCQNEHLRRYSLDTANALQLLLNRSHPNVVNHQDSGCAAALHYMCDADPSLLLQLAQHPTVDVNNRAKDSCTALMLMCHGTGMSVNTELVVDVLLKRMDTGPVVGSPPPVNINTQSRHRKWSALFWIVGTPRPGRAVSASDISIVNRLLCHPDIDLDLVDSNGKTVLEVAAQTAAAGVSDEIMLALLQAPTITVPLLDTPYKLRKYRYHRFRNIYQAYWRRLRRQRRELCLMTRDPTWWLAGIVSGDPWSLIVDYAMRDTIQTIDD